MHTRSLALVLALLPLVLLGCAEAPGEVAERSADVQPTAVNLAIEGMTCEGCVTAIESTVQQIDGVGSCEVSLDEGTAVVHVTDPDVMPIVIEKIEKMKYRTQVIQ